MTDKAGARRRKRPEMAWPPLVWEDDFGHHYRLVCTPLMTGEVMFDLRCLDDTEQFHSNLPRRTAIELAERLRKAAVRLTGAYRCVV